MEASQNKVFSVKRLSRFPLFGIGLAVLSSLLFSTSGLIVKLVGLPPLQMIVARLIIQFIIFTVIVTYKRSKLFVEGERLILVGRGVLGCLGQLFACTAIQLIPLGDASAITFCSPLVVIPLARVLLKEKFTMIQIVSVALSIVGVFLIARPSFIFSDKVGDQTQRLDGILCALGSCLTQATVSVLLRKLQKTSLPVVMLHAAFWGLVTSAPLSLMLTRLEAIDTQSAALGLIIFSIFTILAQLLVTLAFKIEDAGPVSLARTTHVVFAFIFQTTVVHETLLWTSIFGTTLIIISVAAIAVQKWYLQKPELFKKYLPCFNRENNEENELSNENIINVS